LTGFSRGTTLQVFDPEKEEDRDVITKSISNRSILNDLGGSEMRSKKTLRTLSLILTIATLALPSTAIFAAKPPPPIPVTATYRDDPGDALQSDGGGSYAGSLAADGSRLTVSASGHPLCYYETTPFDDDGGDCLEGDLPDGFSICGGGEIVVTPHLESFFDMSNDETQPADATTRIIGDDNFRYFVRFKPSDTLVSDPNCSTPVTLRRIDTNHWEIEGFAGDVARVLTHKIRGGGGYTNRGHYLAPFKISLSSQP
jgi:hypothetical protein